MSLAAKAFLSLIGLTLSLLLATFEPVNAGYDQGAQEWNLGWLEHLRLKPREVFQAKPVMGNKSQHGVTEDITPPLVEEVPQVKGIYLTSWKAGDLPFVEKLMTLMGQTGLNALVVDVKDDTGCVSYPSQVALANEIGADFRLKYRPDKLLELLNVNRIYPIARIVVFKDPLLADKRPDLAVKSCQGGLWKDRHGLRWVDPYQKTVWEYNVALAREAALLGFKEVQFDYVRFTSDGVIDQCRYPGADGRVKAEVICDFLKYAYQELHRLGVQISADVFGLTCSVEDDMGIGQLLPKIAEQVDVVCPMVYPSHYYEGNYNLDDPDAHPYETVYRSLSDACKKVAASQKPKVIIRPWLQDFSLQSEYRAAQLKAQVKAVYDAGLMEWIFWNPSNRYEIEKYFFNNKLGPKD